MALALMIWGMFVSVPQTSANLPPVPESFKLMVGVGGMRGGGPEQECRRIIQVMAA